MTPPLSTGTGSDLVTARPSTLTPSAPVEELGETIAELAARLHAATYELLVMLRDFDARAGWNNGFQSCAIWLHWRTGIDLGAAREKVRVAKALADLSAAMQQGEISYAKVRALTRIATAANEGRLLHVARAGTAAHVERVVRAWRRCDRVEESRNAEGRHLSRALTTWVDDDGMLVLRGRLTPELGAVVQRALDAAAEQLYRNARDTTPAETVADEVTPAQRRADALGLLAECALASTLDGGGAGDRYQVVLHVEAGAGAEPQAAIERGDGGGHVSAETSRRLACDASVVTVRESADGSVLDVGRKTRTIPTAIRRALTSRDQRCTFPGCTARRCDAHHITHWADGGNTSLDNLLLLCRRHHRLVHEGGFAVKQDSDGGVTFIRPDGRRLDAAPALVSHGVIGLGARPGPCWDGTPFNLSYVLDVIRWPTPDRGAPSAVW